MPDPDDKPNLSGRGGGGESGGGAYPHSGKEGGDKDGFLGRGGQTETGYHGHGRLGDEETGGNPNAPAKD